MKLFIFAGQSNAQGAGNRLQLNPVPIWGQTVANGWTGAPTVSSDSGVQYQHPTLANFPMLYNSNNTGLMSGVYDAWGSFEGHAPKPPSGAFSEDSVYGPELSFLRMYQDAHPGEQLAAIKCVLGGSSITDWLTGSMAAIFDATIAQAVARLNAAGITFEFAGLIWHQGESGAASYYSYLHPTIGQEYKDKLRTFISHVRSITSPSMPVVIARIGNHMMLPNIIGTTSSGENTPANRIAATEYRRAEQVEVGGDPGNCWFDTDNLPVLQTGDPAYWYHHPGSGHLAMGERAYYAFSGATPPPPPAPLKTVVKFAGVEQPSKTATVTLNGVAVGGDEDVLVINMVDRL